MSHTYHNIYLRWIMIRTTKSLFTALSLSRRILRLKTYLLLLQTQDYVNQLVPMDAAAPLDTLAPLAFLDSSNRRRRI